MGTATGSNYILSYFMMPGLLTEEREWRNIYVELHIAVFKEVKKLYGTWLWCGVFFPGRTNIQTLSGPTIILMESKNGRAEGTQ